MAKNWLDRMFRGEAVSDAAYNEPEQKEEETMEEALDGTYARRAQTVRSTAQRDNVVEFPRASAGAGSSAGAGTAASTGAGAGTSSFTREGFTKEFRDSGGSGTGGGSGFGGGFSGSGSKGSAAEAADAYVVFKRLKDFTMASQVADRMVENKIVILNLESCDDEVARRVLDFIGGVAYACSSMVKRIAGRVFMITPKGVNADGEFFDEAKQGAAGIRYEE